MSIYILLFENSQICLNKSSHWDFQYKIEWVKVGANNTNNVLFHQSVITGRAAQNYVNSIKSRNCLRILIIFMLVFLNHNLLSY